MSLCALFTLLTGNAMFQIEALGSSSGKPSARVEVVNSGVLQTGCCCVAEQQLRCG